LNLDVLVPDKDAASDTNSVNSLIDQAEVCGDDFGVYPSFILVDFYDAGDGSVFEAAAQLNGVTYNPVKMGKCNGALSFFSFFVPS
jgi:hypothetical protein